MVAKINRGESLFGALVYNKNKVDEQTGRIISSNRMVGDIGNDTGNVMQRMMYSFETNLASNTKVEKPILHISLNPSPEDRLTDEQFAALAEEYLQKMGYGDQPYIVFMHEDTGRRHIHIVTTCIDDYGKRITDKYEWRRSMTACRELEQKYGLVNASDRRLRQTDPYLKKVDYRQGDVKHQISNTLKSILAGYRFQTFGEYSALLSCFNIEVKQVRGEYGGVPYNGVVYTATDDKGRAAGPPFKSSLFGKAFGHDALTRKMERYALAFRQKRWEPKIHDAVRLAMMTCRGDRGRFEKALRGKGIDVMFRKNDQGRIYGVTFIDHNAREVCNGSRLGKEFSANVFEGLFNGPGLSPFDTPDSGRDNGHEHRHASHDMSSSIEAAFGMFDISPSGPVEEPDDDEKDMVPQVKKKKKNVMMVTKRRGRSM